MKKMLVLLFLVILLSSFAQAGIKATSEASTPQIRAVLESQSPDPVEPGQIVTIKFKIENQGKQTNDDVIVKIIPKFPFTLYGDAAEKNIGMLKAVSTGADAVIVEYKLKVDENAVEEEAELELEILTGDMVISYTEDNFLIDVQTHDAVLDITSIISEPKEIAPGETAEISIMVKNLADSLLKDIRFKLNFASSSLPLAPYQSSSERRIAQLNSKYQNTMTFKIIADPDAVPGLYKIPLNITYNDEKGNSYAVEDVLAVIVGEEPKVRAYIKKSTVMQTDKEGKITIEVANAGTSDIKFLELFILPSDDYKLISTNDYFYLGDIDSDDTESEEIDVFATKGLCFLSHPIKAIKFIFGWEENKLYIPVKLKYYDANNKPFQQQFDLELSLYSSSTLRKFGLLGSSNVWTYLLIIIALIAGYFFYLKKKKPEEYARKIKAVKALKAIIPFLKSKHK